MEWWFLNHVGCGATCHCISLRHLLSFRISRIFLKLAAIHRHFSKPFACKQGVE